jgi:hypothetical protein
MKHVKYLSVPSRPVPATSLLEKQATVDYIEQIVTQLTVLLNLIQDIKPGAEDAA